MTSEDIKPPKQHSCRDADLMLTRFIASTLKLQVGSELTLNNVSDETGSRSTFNNNIRIRVPDIALSDIRIVESREVTEHNTLYSLAELDLKAREAEEEKRGEERRPAEVLLDQR